MNFNADYATKIFVFLCFLVIAYFYLFDFSKNFLNKTNGGYIAENNQQLDKSKNVNQTFIKSNSNKLIATQNTTIIHPTIFCLIKTHPKNILINKTLNIYNVWGRKCDNYRFVTLIPHYLRPKDLDNDRTIEVFDKFYMIQPKGLNKESHGNLTLKIYYAVKYVYEKFPGYDWYHIVDDDAYVNINNFKSFLKDKDPKDPATYGFNFKVIVDGGYHSGGPGYVLSNEAFTRLGKALTKNVSNCQNSGIDDVDVNACLRKLGVVMKSSVDAQGRQRFLVLSLLAHFDGSYPGWLNQYSSNELKKVLYSKLVN